MKIGQLRPAANKNQAIFLCASLTDESERQRSFSNNFRDKSLFRFVDSVDGRGWSDSEANAYVSEEMRLLRERERLKGKLWINPAAIACALTHRDKLLAEAEESNVILCEDDVLLNRDFIELWSENEIRETFSKLDSVVLFHYISQSLITTSTPSVAKFGKYRIFKLDEALHVTSGACYYAPPLIAKNIRAHQTPIRISADNWLEMKNNGVFSHIYVVHPSPVQIAGMASNIGYGSAWKSNALWVVMARRLKRLIQRRRQNIHEKLIVRR